MENIFILPVLFPSHRSFNPLHGPLDTHRTKVTENSWNASWETRIQYVTDLSGDPSQLFGSFNQDHQKCFIAAAAQKLLAFLFDK